MPDSSLPSQPFPQTGANRTRDAAITELSQYVGGGNLPEYRERAGFAWDAAVREYNSVAWSFTRTVDDIVVDSHMAPNTTAPTISATTGGGIGFTLTAGAQIHYWVEERIKHGARILERNDSLSAGPGLVQATLTGTGGVVRPVITRPAIVNPDATHWALYGTTPNTTIASAEPFFPKGAELAETTFDVTTLEDERVGINPPLGLQARNYQDGEYDLSGDFRNPVRALALDAANQTRYILTWMPWRQWVARRPWQITTGSNPIWYTIRNVHGVGRVSFDPRPGTQTTYPRVRVHYNRRIALASTTDAVLDVPAEVDEAIFQLAIAKILSKVRSMDEARTATALAAQLRVEVEAQWRDFEDYS